MVHLWTFVKTALITFIVVIVLEAGFYGYMKFFNQPLMDKLVGYIYTCTPNDASVESIQTGDAVSDQLGSLSAKIESLQAQLEKIGSDIQNISIVGSGNTTASMPVANAQRTVKLYYFNQDVDNQLPEEQRLNIASVVSVDRTISSSTNLIRDTIDLLLQGKLTKEETAGGYVTAFPNKDFTLKNATLSPDGTLVLEMTEVLGFTSGGSARQILLRASVEKTAKQFPEVKAVKFVPDTLFQP